MAQYSTKIDNQPLNRQFGRQMPTNIFRSGISIPEKAFTLTQEANLIIFDYVNDHSPKPKSFYVCTLVHYD